MLLFVRCLVFFLIVTLSRGDEEFDNFDKEDMAYWYTAGRTHLNKVLAHTNTEKQAKNIIVFIGDGMGLSTITAGRIFKGQSKGGYGEEYKLSFEDFPNTGLSKTYNVDRQVPDSAGTATALFSGVKSRYRMLGLDSKAQYDKCDRQINDISKLTTVVTWAQQSGLDTGFVTTTRVTHATPGALYAHINNRDWECDSKIPREYRGCTKDIARQLIEDSPGQDFKVIMGGGGKTLGITVKEHDTSTCSREDRKNLTRLWQSNNPDGKIVTSLKDLMNVDIRNTSKLMGIFASGHLPYQGAKDPDTPSLTNMTRQAIRMLRKNKKGFFLMVEGGKIDIAHHQNYAKLALKELSDFDDAIRAALSLVKLEETLIIVTADHSHAFTFNGYPKRGNDILGFANQTRDVKPYETLSYANGPGFYYHRDNDSDNVYGTWRPVEKDNNRSQPFYRNFACRPLEDETHGGEDVGVYAIGPYSHLFRGTFEQNYVAHVIAFAGCYRDWPSHCDGVVYRHFNEVGKSSASNSSILSHYLVISIALAWMLASKRLS